MLPRNKKRYELGTIQLGSKVYVSDPCYKPGIAWNQPLIDNIKPGEYYGFINKATINGWGRRVTDLWISHKDNLCKMISTNTLDEYEVGVDSGAAGIFDKDYYETLNRDSWYERQYFERRFFDIAGNLIYDYDDIIKGRVETRDAVALDSKCVVSFSGYGDGIYKIYTGHDYNGKINEIRINFI